MKDIAQFEEGVRALEREMHKLSKVETEARGVLDEEAKVELREQKTRLEREIGIMLQKISDRKGLLTGLPPFMGLKVGDTIHTQRFGVQGVKNESPVARRYGGTCYSSIGAEWFVTSYATRAVRVVTELCANWVAAESVKSRFVHSPITGEEGFFGRASFAEAESAILGVYDTLKKIDVFRAIFEDADTGVRSFTGGWKFDDF